jgi:hypothetical protein
MKGAPKEYECDHVLIVEGYSDLLFCAAFLRHLGRIDGVFIKVFEGKQKILKGDLLQTYLSERTLAEKKSIGVLLDADDNPSGAVAAISSRLKEITGRELVEAEWNEGSPRLGFFVAPDANTPGEIETLTWNAFRADLKHSEMKTAVLGYLEKMEALGWKAHSPDKARIGAFLSAAYDEDPRLGPGAREKLFDFDAPGFTRLRHFLEGLR